MKRTLTATFLLSLLLTLSSQTKAQDTKDRNKTADGPTVDRFTLTFELGELPGANPSNALWHVSYRWRIADQNDLLRWSEEGEDPATQDAVGMLLSEYSFTRRNLSSARSRRFSRTVPVKGDLLERLRNAGRRRQIVWLDAVVKVHDRKSGREVVKRVNPSWGSSFYQHGSANVRMELTDDWKLQWYTGTTPPWVKGDKVVTNSSGKPSPR